MENDYSKMSQDDLIKILDFICKHKDSRVIPSSIKNDLFPDLELNEFNSLLRSLVFMHIEPITIMKAGDDINYLIYRKGLEDYVKNLKQIEKREKLHRIIEFLSIESEKLNKSSFDSEEIANAFTPKLDIYEVNTLCRMIINQGDLKGWSDKDLSAKGMVGVLVITETHDAYHTKKYLEEEEQFTIPIKESIITGDNVIVGNISGDVNQVDHSANPTKVKGKVNWLKIFYWTISILVGLTVIVTFIFKYLHKS
jgi:hypothetical protein